MVIGFVYMVLMKFCAGVIIWGALFLYLTFLGVLGYVFYNEQKATSED